MCASTSEGARSEDGSCTSSLACCVAHFQFAKNIGLCRKGESSHEDPSEFKTLPSVLLGSVLGVLHWHEVGVEQPRRVKHELDDVRGPSNSTSGHTELIERESNVPTILSPSTYDFWLVPVWFTCALLLGSFTVCLVCWVVSDRQSKSQVLRSLIVASNNVVVGAETTNTKPSSVEWLNSSRVLHL